jgi:hypothetical protein
MELPTGTVTFLFTDIEGSTRLLQELGDAYGSIQDDHMRLKREPSPPVAVRSSTQRAIRSSQYSQSPVEPYRLP